MEAMLRRSLENGQIDHPLAKSDPEAWLAMRLYERRAIGECIGESTHVTGRSYQFKFARTTEGGQIVVQTDITERKLAEQELGKSQEAMRALADNLPVLISFKDSEGRFIFVNKRFEEWNGVKRQDVIGKTLRDIYSVEQVVTMEAMDEQVMTEQVVLPQEVDFSYLDGKTRSVISTRFPVVSSSGETIGIGTINIDITELKEAERRLQESEAQLRNILQTSPIGVAIVTDNTAERVYTNPQFNEMFGDDPNDSLAGRDIADSWMDQKKLEAFQQRARESGWHFDVEEYRKRADGTPWWCQMTSRPIDYHDEPAHMVWHYDITERKRAEEALAEKEAQLRVVLDNIPAGVRYVDEHRNYVFFNTQYSDLYEFPNDLLKVGEYCRTENLFQARRGDFGPGDPEKLADDWIGHLPVETESTNWERLTPAGKILQIMTEPIPQGGFVNIATDITKRKKAEEALKSQSELIELLRKTASEANKATDFDDAMRTCLDTVCAFTGWPVGHVYVRADGVSDFLKPTKIWHLDDWDRFAVFREITESSEIRIGTGLVSRVFENCEPQWIENVTEDKKFSRVQNAAGDVVIRSGFALPVLSQDSVVAVLEFYTDQMEQRNDGLLESLIHIGVQLGRVFERQQAEAALQQLNDQKDKFFSIIAHDLKGPFNALLGYSSLLSSGISDFNQAQVVEYSGAVHESAERVFKLLENLLEWSRLQMGRLEFEPGPVDLKEIFDTNLALYAPIAEEKVIRLVGKRRKSLLVFADAHMVDTVVRNLVNNAIKFTPAEGDVILSARRNGKWAEIAVSDTGVGISSDNAARLFQLDEKTSTLGTDGESGTGLGLQLCKELVERQGGQIQVESATGEGSIFRVTLPLFHE